MHEITMNGDRSYESEVDSVSYVGGLKKWNGRKKYYCIIIWKIKNQIKK